MAPLDQIRELDPGRAATAIRHVPNTLEVFTTHFPLFPVLPGVFILDDLVRVARLALGVVKSDTGEATEGRIWELVHARRIRFRHFVEPGDSMEISVEVSERDCRTATCSGIVRVDGRTVTTATKLILRSVEEPA